MHVMKCCRSSRAHSLLTHQPRHLPTVSMSIAYSSMYSARSRAPSCWGSMARPAPWATELLKFHAARILGRSGCGDSELGLTSRELVDERQGLRIGGRHVAEVYGERGTEEESRVAAGNGRLVVREPTLGKKHKRGTAAQSGKALPSLVRQGWQSIGWEVGCRR